MDWFNGKYGIFIKANEKLYFIGGEWSTGLEARNELESNDLLCAFVEHIDSVDSDVFVSLLSDVEGYEVII